MLGEIEVFAIGCGAQDLFVKQASDDVHKLCVFDAVMDLIVDIIAK